MSLYLILLYFDKTQYLDVSEETIEMWNNKDTRYADQTKTVFLSRYILHVLREASTRIEKPKLLLFIIVTIELLTTASQML